MEVMETAFRVDGPVFVHENEYQCEQGFWGCYAIEMSVANESWLDKAVSEGLERSWWDYHSGRPCCNERNDGDHWALCLTLSSSTLLHVD